MNPLELAKTLRWRLTKKLFVNTARSTENLSYNKKLWNHYAKYWDPALCKVEDPAVTTIGQKQQYLEFMGDEWGKKEAVSEVVAEYIAPFVNHTSVVAEIGLGHGRIASKVAPSVKEFWGFDISPEFLAAARDKLASHKNVKSILLEGNAFPPECGERFDFVYSFDVFVHLDLHTMRDWFVETRRALKRDGKFFVHTSNIRTRQGWDRFAKQRQFSVEGHYLVIPELVRLLASRTGFSLVKESAEEQDNVYKARDYLAVFAKE